MPSSHLDNQLHLCFHYAPRHVMFVHLATPAILFSCCCSHHVHLAALRGSEAINLHCLAIAWQPPALTQPVMSHINAKFAAQRHRQMRQRGQPGQRDQSGGQPGRGNGRDEVTGGLGEVTINIGQQHGSCGQLGQPGHPNAASPVRMGLLADVLVACGAPTRSGRVDMSPPWTPWPAFPTSSGARSARPVGPVQIPAGDGVTSSGDQRPRAPEVTSATAKSSAKARAFTRWDGSAWTDDLDPARSAAPQRQQDLRNRARQRVVDENTNELMGQQMKRQTCVQHMRTIDAYRTLHQVSHWSDIPREPCIWSACSKREWEKAVQLYRNDLVAAHEALLFSV